jgi:poly(3-hydroxybutyrate) depolymerase
MKPLAASVIFFFAVTACPGQQAGDIFYHPADAKKPAPALIILSCTGATRADLDSCRPIADSLGWTLATCAKSRNHREASFNDYDIMATYSALASQYPVDRKRIFIYGFSGQGVQAMMSVFLHPDCFRGAVSICGHDGAMGLARWEKMRGKAFYLVTRQKDWNREANVKIHAALKQAGSRDTLIITKGKHEPRGFREVYLGCRWLDKKTKQM